MPGLSRKKAHLEDVPVEQWSLGQLTFFVVFFTLVCGSFIWLGLARWGERQFDSATNVLLGCVVLWLVYREQGVELLRRILARIARGSR